MTDEQFILDYTNKYYDNENRLIERTMINYYFLKNKEDRNEKEEFYMVNLYDGILELFDIMSKKLEEELGLEAADIYSTLKDIHIKT